MIEVELLGYKKNKVISKDIVLIDPEYIVVVIPNTLGSTTIHMVNNRALDVSETVLELKTKINEV